MQKDTNNPINRVAAKIEEASNILVAVSKNPTIDELSAAIGLTIMLDGMGKHATAIFSGEAPASLQFLEPEKTFEADTNSLQDFIIALSKDKADHLRYKIDGDYVKVFITPYKTTIDEDDLEFSHGDFNIDLLMTLGVPEVEDLDAALYEHGKILHDADSINISNDTPGKFGEIQWTDPAVSSVSEMVAGLAFSMRDKVKMTKTVATALLTGIVANTARFLNEKTTPKTMDVASRLMQAGANQQLISSNLEEALSEGGLSIAQGTGTNGELDIGNDDELSAEQQLDQMIAQPGAVSGVMSDLAQASEDVAQPEVVGSALNPDAPDMNAVLDAMPTGNDNAVADVNIVPQAAPINIQPEAPAQVAPVEEPVYEGPKDYGQMMEEALAEPLPNPAAQAAPTAPTSPEMSHIPEMEYVPHTATTPVTVPTMGNEFLTAQPGMTPMQPGMQMPTQPGMQVPTQPEVQMPPVQQAQPVQPEMQIPAQSEMTVPGDVQLPPPPVPPVPGVEPMAAQPMMQPEQTVSQLEQANDPGAFKIPGM